MNRWHEAAVNSLSVGYEAHDHGDQTRARYFWYEYKVLSFIGNLVDRLTGGRK